jgi:ActD protein
MSWYGITAEFGHAEALLEAVRATRNQGYRKLEAYTPFSVEGLPEALDLPPNRVALVTLLGGIVGGAGAFFLQWYSAVVDYPINSGGRPLNSWPAFIPAVFELAVLGAALAGFFGMLALNGLPRLRHPIFDTPDFHLASRNRFFLCVRSEDPLFDLDRTEAWLRTLSPVTLARTPAGARA